MLLEQMEKKAAEEASNNLRVQNRKYMYNMKSLFTLDSSDLFHVLCHYKKNLILKGKSPSLIQYPVTAF